VFKSRRQPLAAFYNSFVKTWCQSINRELKIQENKKFTSCLTKSFANSKSLVVKQLKIDKFNVILKGNLQK
jgi:hypothetical protein